MATMLDKTADKNGRNQLSDSSKALWGGIIFSFVFTALIWLLRPLIPEIDFLPDTGASWYYWKLPEQTVMGRVTAWGGYALHQIAMWSVIYYAQTKVKHKYTNSLHRINAIALALNALFVVLHMMQTYIWYDALAQDVSIFSSQGSVILMLVMVLLMENQRRGLFWGKKVGFLKETGRVARKYHGYIFSWAIIYTFWYHPAEATMGHLIGFLYTFLLMVQGSLIYTRAHVNKYWTFALEIFVLFHGTLVAINQGIGYGDINRIWPMFFFGFAGIFIVTQMHGIGLNQWARWGFLGLYLFSVIGVYSQIGWDRLNEIIRIPFIEYVLVFVLAGIIWGLMKLVGLYQNREPRPLPSGD